MQIKVNHAIASLGQRKGRGSNQIRLGKKILGTVMALGHKHSKDLSKLASSGHGAKHIDNQ